ncbi:uncharacterized protein LOC118478765 [Aplysia californica]|uniref:Uncharacterized protein LOC118478765 n=1 Tax=Aplysia californica TaxID=6500 RepID=A0ABM1W2E1_APLCA|nr:uncharacterized protein LOC118478765 [Aplysia californica]
MTPLTSDPMTSDLMSPPPIPPDAAMTPEESALRLSYLVLVSLTSAFGNLLVLVALCRFRSLRRSANLMLSSLAVADFLVGTITVPLYIAWTARPGIFDRSSFMCALVLLSCLLLVTASHLSLLFLRGHINVSPTQNRLIIQCYNLLVLFSFEQYFAVCQPFKHRDFVICYPWIHQVAIVLIWFFSAVFTGISSFAIDTGGHTCSYYGKFNHTFLLVSSVCGVLGPLVLIVVLNVRVLCEAQNQDKRRQSLTYVTSNSLSFFSGGGSPREKKERQDSSLWRNELLEETTTAANTTTTTCGCISGDKRCLPQLTSAALCLSIFFSRLVRGRAERGPGRARKAGVAFSHRHFGQLDSDTSALHNCASNDGLPVLSKLPTPSTSSTGVSNDNCALIRDAATSQAGKPIRIRNSSGGVEAFAEEMLDPSRFRLPSHGELIEEIVGPSYSRIPNPGELAEEMLDPSYSCISSHDELAEGMLGPSPSRISRELAEGMFGPSYSRISGSGELTSQEQEGSGRSTDTSGSDSGIFNFTGDQCDPSPTYGNDSHHFVVEIVETRAMHVLGGSCSNMLSAENVSDSNILSAQSTSCSNMLSAGSASCSNIMLSAGSASCSNMLSAHSTYYSNVRSAQSTSCSNMLSVGSASCSNILSAHTTSSFLTTDSTSGSNTLTTDSAHNCQLYPGEISGCVTDLPGSNPDGVDPPSQPYPGDTNPCGRTATGNTCKKHAKRYRAWSTTDDLMSNNLALIRPNCRRHSEGALLDGKTELGTAAINRSLEAERFCQGCMVGHQETPRMDESAFVRSLAERRGMSVGPVNISCAENNERMSPRRGLTFYPEVEQCQFSEEDHMEEHDGASIVDCAGQPLLCENSCTPRMNTRHGYSHSSRNNPFHQDYPHTRGNNSCFVDYPQARGNNPNCQDYPHIRGNNERFLLDYPHTSTNNSCRRSVRLKPVSPWATIPHKGRTNNGFSLNDRTSRVNFDCGSINYNTNSNNNSDNDNDNGGDNYDIRQADVETTTTTATTTTADALVSQQPRRSTVHFSTDGFSRLPTMTPPSRGYSSAAFGNTRSSNHDASRPRTTFTLPRGDSALFRDHHAKDTGDDFYSRLRSPQSRRESNVFRDARGDSNYYFVSGQIAKMVALVCASFILAWFPFAVVIIINIICSHCHLDYFLNAVIMIAFTKSVSNPVIYALCRVGFRRAYSNVLRSVFLGICCRGEGRGSSRNRVYGDVSYRRKSRSCSISSSLYYH